MSISEFQQMMIDKQAALVEKQTRLAALIGEYSVKNPEWHPNADELLIAANDGVEKALEAVDQILTRLDELIGDN